MPFAKIKEELLYAWFVTIHTGPISYVLSPFRCENCGLTMFPIYLSPIKPGYWWHCRRCYINKYERWEGSGLWARLSPGFGSRKQWEAHIEQLAADTHADHRTS